MGDGIIISSIILGTIVLFVATKDRWNWSRGIKRTSALFLIVFGVGSSILYLGHLPKRQVEYLGIKLGESKQDVLFKAGFPKQGSTDTDLFFEKNMESSLSGTHATLNYGVNFYRGEVRFVAFSGTSDSSAACPIEGVHLNDSIETIIKRFGNGYVMSSNKDGGARIYSYPKHNVFFVLLFNSVMEMGIYDPTIGPMKFVYEGGYKKVPHGWYGDPTIQATSNTH